MNQTRREMFATAGAAAALASVAPQAFAAWEPSERYPDPAIRSLGQSVRRNFAAGCR
jgi:hypothetical protein